jgi:ribosomal protein L7/L12
VDNSIFGIIVLCIFIVGVLGQLWALDRRSRRTERNLVALMQHLGIPGSEPPAPSDTVKALASDPRGKIAAIKAYRAESGLGLVEAKEAVERLAPPRSSGGV